MFTFTLSALAGALIGGSYVLIRTPRTGEENQQFVKEFVQTTKLNLQNVSEQALNMEHAIQNLTTEIQIIQESFIPEVMEIADDFKTEAAVSTRRINDEIVEINRELSSLDLSKDESPNIDM